MATSSAPAGGVKLAPKTTVVPLADAGAGVEGSTAREVPAAGTRTPGENSPGTATPGTAETRAG